MLKSDAGNMGRNKIRTLKTPQKLAPSKAPLVFLNLQWSETSLLRPPYKIIMAIHYKWDPIQFLRHFNTYKPSPNKPKGVVAILDTLHLDSVVSIFVLLTDMS